MKILLVAATEFEIAPLISFFKKAPSEKNVQSYMLRNKQIDVLITGVGMTLTAYQLAKTLSDEYDLAINAGVAGSFKQDIPLGTVVDVVSDSFADMGAEDGDEFIPTYEMGLADRSAYNIRSVGYGKELGLMKVRGITVNTVHGNTASIKKVVKKFNPDIESMEGAAFFYACSQENIPCIQIRSISNYVERRDKSKWRMDLAIHNLNAFLLDFLRKQ
jgi:futalosine hydrolase